MCVCVCVFRNLRRNQSGQKLQEKPTPLPPPPPPETYDVTSDGRGRRKETDARNQERGEVQHSAPPGVPTGVWSITHGCARLIALAPRVTRNQTAIDRRHASDANRNKALICNRLRPFHPSWRSKAPRHQGEPLIRGRRAWAIGHQHSAIKSTSVSLKERYHQKELFRHVR